MKIYEKKLEILEISLANNKNPKNSLVLSNRYFLNFFITNDEELIKKSLNTCIFSFNENPYSIELFLYIIFLYIQSYNFEKAKDMIYRISLQKNYYKNKNPQIYITYLFLQALYEIRKGNLKYLKKYRKQNLAIEEGKDSAQHFLFQGIIEFETENYIQASNFFTNSYYKNNSQLYLYIYLNKFFLKVNDILNREIFYNTMIWSVNNDVDISKILDDFTEFFKKENIKNLDFLKNSYRRYSNSFLLSQICLNLSEKNDTSLQSYYYFKEAENKQLISESLIEFYIKLSIIHKNEDLNRYTISNYLFYNRMSTETKAYIYYLLVSNKNFSDLLIKHSHSINNFTMIALENKVINKYYLNLYSYLFYSVQKTNTNKQLQKNIFETIFEFIFSYEIQLENEEISFICIFEEEKKQMEKYSVTNKKAFVELFSEKFTYIFLDSTQKKVIIEKCVFKKIITILDKDDLKIFYQLIKQSEKSLIIKFGKQIERLLIYLSKVYVSKDKRDFDYVEILTETLKFKISNEFRAKINIALGNILLLENKSESAIKNFLNIDFDFIDDTLVESILMVFLKEKQYKSAIELLLKRHNNISDKSLFFAAKDIAKQSIYDEFLADICYKLLIKSWYDKILIDIVINNYNGSINNWEQLSTVLSSISVDEKRIDEMILKNSMYMKIYDTGIEKVFKRVFENNKNKSLIKDFVYFTTYKIIVDKINIDYATINILEQIYKENNDKLICYGLACNYIMYGIINEDCEKIIIKAQQNMKNDEIILAEMKNIKDKNIITTYIEKNQPFMYKTYPNRKVFIYYKFDDESNFSKKEMKYFKFGMYITSLINFFNENITYFFSEESASGSVETHELEVSNSKISFIENKEDDFFNINNALIYEKMFKYEKVVDIIIKELEEEVTIKARLI